MKLSGKCKEDFEEWANINCPKIYDYAIENDDKTGIPTYEGRYFHYQVFEDLPESMQFGVIQDFADSKGYDIITRNKANRFISFSSPTNTTKKFYIDEHNTRQEARLSAIEKFNEMYNEK